MKYAIMGRLFTDDDTKIRGVINRYRFLDKESLNKGKTERGKPEFTFELKTDKLSKKNGMFAEFKALVDEYAGHVDWHECTHDEAAPRPCEIAEAYRRE